MRLLSCLGCTCLLAQFSVRAMFMFEETRLVPVGRLLTNLQRQAAIETNSFTLIYQLARLHSLAYATNQSEIPVTRKDGRAVFGFPGSDVGVPRVVQTFASETSRQTAFRELTNAIALYERALVLLKSSTNVNEQRWMILPTQLGLAWCLDQSGLRDQALTEYRKTLQIAWHQEVTGDFDLKVWLTDTWNDLRSGKTPIHPRTRGHLGPGVCYSEEVIAYLLKLLDPVKDKSEIAELKERQKILGTMGRAITPIFIPVQPDACFAELVNPQANVAFDLDGSGKPRPWGWITPKAAWLVYDPEGKGQIKSGLQMFGNVTFWIFWQDGYAALAALDDDRNGRLSGTELRGLGLWRDANGNGLSEPAEVLPIQSYGIKALSCDHREYSGGTKWSPQGVSFSDGSARPSYDWLAPSD